MSVTVYTKPGCGPCAATKRALQAKGVPYQEIDVSQDAAALAFIQGELGYRGVPVIYVAADQHWQGFQEDRIRALVSCDPS